MIRRLWIRVLRLWWIMFGTSVRRESMRVPMPSFSAAIPWTRDRIRKYHFRINQRLGSMCKCGHRKLEHQYMSGRAIRDDHFPFVQLAISSGFRLSCHSDGCSCIYFQKDKHYLRNVTGRPVQSKIAISG